MAQTTTNAGYFHNRQPYNRFGHGPRNLVVFQGLLFENKPLSGFMAGAFSGPYKSLGSHYTVYIVTRKPGLPEGYSMKDMADDYAVMIREEFGGPVDAIGVSTGGSIVQHFAADHPELVRKLVIHSSAYTLSEVARDLQMRVGRLAQQRKWKAAYAEMLGDMFPNNWPGRMMVGFVSSLAGMPIFAPKDPSDLVITIEAEDKHDFKERLVEITAPTLVVAGDKDPFYTVELFRETAEGIPNARLILYEGMGHPASGKQFNRDVLAFLNEDKAP